MQRVYVEEKRALAYFDQQATAKFWDAHWEIDDLRQRILSCKSDSLFIPLVRKYISRGGTVLEGGCGQGQLVHALHYKGYRAIGIDFAEKLVHNIKAAVPELDVSVGDVRNLPLQDTELDGYISVGVIEHFLEGYSSILEEMKRTLKPGGFLFISFPYMSPLRKLKAVLRCYPNVDFKTLDDQKNQFYQFALEGSTVLHDLSELGFILKKVHPYDGIKGFKNEVTWFRPWLQSIYDGRTHRKFRKRLDKLLRPFSAHCLLLVMQKRGD